MRRTIPLFALLLTLSSTSAIEVGGITFSEGESWKPKATARPISKGGLIIEASSDTPDVKATTLSADFYYFGKGQGGSVKANIARWNGQFQQGATSKTEEIPLDGIEGKSATLVFIQGTFLSGPPFGGKKTPVPGHAMLGAIVPGTEAPIFIKLTGNEKAVKIITEKFKKLIRTASATK